jgi:hypothetical protein
MCGIGNPSQTQIQPNPGLVKQNSAKFLLGKSLDFLGFPFPNRALSMSYADP